MWAALFPGQGSQSVGMGLLLHQNFPLVRELFQQASDTLSIDFKQLCFSGPESELNLTMNSQPAIVLASTAYHRVITQETGIEFKIAAGHSVGEYSACVAAGAMSFTAALKAVRVRGMAMQEAVPVGKGGMIAVMGLDDAQATQLCHWAVAESKQGVLEPANFNTPGQVVLSGDLSAIEWLQKNIAQASSLFVAPVPRIRIIPLKVSAPFHCSMMKPAEIVMREELSKINFSDATFPIIQNARSELVIAGFEVRTNLIDQIVAPVHWVQCIRKLIDFGADKAIELGAGQVVSGLVKKIDSERLALFNIQSMEDLEKLAKFQPLGESLA